MDIFHERFPLAQEMNPRKRLYIWIGASLLIVVTGLYIFWRTSVGPRMMLDAIASEDTNRMTWIARSGIDPNSDVFLIGGLLHCAAARGANKSMEHLAALGADIDRLDGYGMTPMMVSVKMGSPEAYRWLVSNGANAKLLSRDGKTARDYFLDLDEQSRKVFPEVK